MNWIKNAIVYSKEGGVMPTLQWLVSRLVSEQLAFVLYCILLGLALIVTGRLFWKWRRGGLPALALIAWCAWVTAMVDPSSLSPDRNVLLIPIFLWAAHQAQIRAVIITWGAGILGTNLAFVFTLTGVFPNAVGSWSIIFYTIWLVCYWVSLPGEPLEGLKRRLLKGLHPLILRQQ